MSGTCLTVIATDPYWQPGRQAAEGAAAALARMLPDDARRGLHTRWHDSVEVVDCGVNLEKISCPQCGAQLAFDWWGEAVSQRYDEGFRTLTVTVPCCGVETSLNELAYDWPMGFARFRLEARHPNRARLTGEELAALTDALGHPLRQILARI